MRPWSSSRRRKVTISGTRRWKIARKSLCGRVESRSSRSSFRADAQALYLEGKRDHVSDNHGRDDQGTSLRLGHAGHEEPAGVRRRAGPFYVAVSLAQALTRDGFDLTRHAWSMLANGSLGWIQITNLIVTGLIVISGG